MSSTEYTLELHGQHVQVTSDDIRKAVEPFQRGWSDGSDEEELVLDISSKLIESIGMTNEGDIHNLTIIAGVFKILTTGRTVQDAREYLSSDQGALWVNQLILPGDTIEAPEMASAASTPENDPIVAVELNEVVVGDGRVADVPQHVDSFIETFPAPLQELAAATRQLKTVGLEVPATTQPLFPGNLTRGPIHHDGPQIIWVISEQLGRDPEILQILGLPIATSGQQPSLSFREGSRQQRRDYGVAAGPLLLVLTVAASLIAFVLTVDLLWRLVDLFLRLLSKPN